MNIRYGLANYHYEKMGFKALELHQIEGKYLIKKLNLNT